MCKRYYRVGSRTFIFAGLSGKQQDCSKVLHEVLDGIVEGCRQAGCALIGGETPEMPGFYHEDEYDIAGFVVGVVEKDRIINGKTIKPGGVVIGLSSSGVHSNGFSLVRKVFLIRQNEKATQRTYKVWIEYHLGEELIKPTKIYIEPILKILNKHKTKKSIKGWLICAVVGLLKIYRVSCLKAVCCYVGKSKWNVPKIFEIIQEIGNIDDQEMFHVLTWVLVWCYSYLSQM